MAYLEVNNATASIGVIRDTKPYLLPPEAWTEAHNVRYIGRSAAKLLGYTRVFSPLPQAPHWAMTVLANDRTWWLWAGDEEELSGHQGTVYAFDGNTHGVIGTIPSTGLTRDWNGTLFGGIPIINNWAGPPQYWAPYGMATMLAPIPAWDSGWKCRTIKAFGAYLVAANITKGNAQYAHMVKWSHYAKAGSLPPSWDEADLTVDANEFDLSDVDSGVIQTALQLGTALFIYKETAIWGMRFVGGTLIFRLDPFSTTAGVLSPRAVTTLGDGMWHAALTQDDLIVHNGQSVDPILSDRWKEALFQDIDPVFYQNAFLFTNPAAYEVWVCYPERGAEQPNKALVWNYKQRQGKIVSTADCLWRNATLGTVEQTDPFRWGTPPIDNVAPEPDPRWNSNEWRSAQWSVSERRRVIVCDTDRSEFQMLDSTDMRNGVPFRATLGRQSLSLIGRTSQNEPIVNFSINKFVTRIWLKVVGGPIDVRLGWQTHVNGPINWTATQSFNPETDEYLDFEISGRAISVEFSSFSQVNWSLEGYAMDLYPAGGH